MALAQVRLGISLCPALSFTWLLYEILTGWVPQASTEGARSSLTVQFLDSTQPDLLGAPAWP